MNRRLTVNAAILCGTFAFSACSGQSPSAPSALGAGIALDANSPDTVSAGPAASTAERTSNVTRISDGSVIAGAYSRLVRTSSGISATMHTSDLVPGSAYTLWVVIFNNPAGCVMGCGNDDLTNAAAQPAARFGVGHLVGQSGQGTFSAHIPVGNTGAGLPTAPPPPFGPGLLNPLGAEIHLVVRTHGPASPESLPGQISSFNGGCPPNACANVQASVHTP